MIEEIANHIQIAINALATSNIIDNQHRLGIVGSSDIEVARGYLKEILFKINHPQEQ